MAEFPANLPPLAQAEKDYFTALSNFYTRDPKLIQQSADQFKILAGNKNYPWHDWMSYLAIRAQALAVFVQQEQQLEALNAALNANTTVNIFALIQSKNKYCSKHKKICYSLQ